MTEPVARARITRADGSSEDVTDQIVGADQYFAAWKPNVGWPDRQTADAWQQSDDLHPIGTGQPAYRVVYRTLRVVPFPPVSATFPNLRLRVENGDVERGGFEAKNVIPGRRVGETIVPEHGRWITTPTEDQVTYVSSPNLTFEYAGWEETIEAVSFVEVIWKSDDETERSVSALLDLGRNAVTTLLAILEIEFGPRILASRMLEEVGETFPDWHWNRHASARAVYAESQADLIYLSGEDFIRRIRPLIERKQELSREEEARWRLACRWAFSAQEEHDPVLEFLYWWLVVEALEMPNTRNISRARRRVAKILDCNESRISSAFGRLFGTRGKLVHGEDRTVSQDQLVCIRAVARMLLAARLATVSPSDIEAVSALLQS